MPAQKGLFNKIKQFKAHVMTLRILFICCGCFGMSASEPVQLHIQCKQQITSCACMTEYGPIDLSPIDPRQLYNPLFQNKWDPSMRNMFSYNPCSDFTDTGSGNCYTVAACQIRDNYRWPLGSQSSATFNTDSADGLQLVYKGTQDVTERTAHVQLLCDHSADTPTLKVEGERESANFYMSLISKHCCPPNLPVTSGGLSVGSILCIILAVIAPVYIIGGMAIKRTRMGAEGVEMLPNRSFWQALPGLVKDGAVFVVGFVRRLRPGSGSKQYEEL